MLGFNSKFGRRVLRRLKSEKIIWLTTVGPEGTPQPRPVWFYWDGTSILIYSQPQAHKIQHIKRQPRVALHLNTDAEGGDVAVLLGMASVAGDAPPADKHPGYRRKYREGIAGLGMNPTTFAQDYSVALRIQPAKLRGF